MNKITQFIMILIILFISLIGECLAVEKISLQLRWFHQFQFAGYYAAIEKGFYQEVGLDVSIKEGGLQINTIEEVLSNRAQYGVSNAEILLHRLQQKPRVVLAAIFQHPPSF